MYCIEIYKTAKKLSGREVIRVFKEYKVNEYIKKCFEALHTTGEKYIVNDIDLFIKARQM